MTDIKPQENTAAEPAPKAEAKKQVYRSLSIKERDLLFAFYEKWNGNMSQMILDKDCPFHSYAQVHFYVHFHHFKEKHVEIRTQKAREVVDGLQDAKIKALENAIRLLQPQHRFVYNKSGMQVFDTDGKPLIVEQLPYYKEIKAAWEIIKTELGEPTNIHKNDITSGGEKIQGNLIQFVDFNASKSQQ